LDDSSSSAAFFIPFVLFFLYTHSVMKSRAIIFDLDGTLVDTIPLYEEAYLSMLASAGVGCDPDEFRSVYEKFRETYALNIHLSESLKLYGIPQTREEEMRRVRDAEYCELVRTRVEWFPDAKRLLDALPAATPKAIVTGSWQHFVDAIEERLPLSQYIEVIVTSEEFRPHVKPDPAGLLIAAQKLRVPPQDCVYVGDQEFDMEAARRAGMQACLIVREDYTPPRAEEKADICVHSLEELIN
jgi:HAD superfamily hydrolase (TIGR01509 family)